MPLQPAFPPEEMAAAGEAEPQTDQLYDPADDGAGAQPPIGQGGETNVDIDSHAPTDDAIADAVAEQGTLDGEVNAAADDAGDTGGDADGQETVEYPQYLLDASGLTVEQAHAEFGSPEALEEQVAASDLRAIQYGLAAPPAQGQPLPPQQPLPPTQPLQQQPLGQPAEQKPFELPKPASGAEDWDEDTKLLMEHMNKQHQEALAARDAELDAIKQQFTAMNEQAVQRNVQNYVAEFDAFVNGLDESWAPVFGRGSGQEMIQNNLGQSLAMKNREQLDAVAVQLQNMQAARNLPPLPTGDCLRRAMRIAFEAETEREVEQQVTQRVATQQRRHTNRPTMRRSTPLSNVEKAAATADQFYAKFGLPAEDDGDMYADI